MANLAIKGHATRGREVIELLEMLGGINRDGYCGDLYEKCYFIKDNYVDWTTEKYLESDSICFTLEGFLEKYPYKVGDKVIAYDYNLKDWKEVKITSMRWLEDEILYNALPYHNLRTNDLQPYKEETMEEAEMLLGWVVESKGKRLIPHKDYEIKQDGDVFYLVKKNRNTQRLIRSAVMC